MSLNGLIVSFIAIGIVLCLAIVLMPATGSIAVFLIAIVAGGVFLAIGLRDSHLHSAAHSHSRGRRFRERPPH